MIMKGFLGAILAAALAITACGDGPKSTSPTAPTTAAKTGTRVAGPKAGDPFGPAPKLGANITKVNPAHGMTVTQESTRSPIADRPNGVCFEADFAGLAENVLWFRMAFDGEEVTTKMTWVTATRTDAKGGRGCYAPAAGFTAGRHQVAASVQDPNNPAVAPRQVIAWEFDVK
jgi:hypothetical protein